MGLRSAREILVKGLEHDPNDEDLLYACAQLLYSNFDKTESLYLYNRLIKLHPDNQTYITLRGNTYLDLKLNALAMREYKHAHFIDPEAAWINSNIGNLYKNRGLYYDGIEYLTKAVEFNPESQYAHERLSHTYKSLEKELENLAKLEREGTKSFLSWTPPVVEND